MHTAFITGCATGFGHGLARHLLHAGHRVVATDAISHGLEVALGGPHPRLLVLACDVRDSASVAAAAREALAWAPVDVLVNNAGYALFAAQEEAPVEDVAAMFDVNVFGVARVTKALLPSLRATAGVIVQLSSVAGTVVFPESGYYAASKFAIEAMSDALAQETAPWGVRLRVIQPGSFATEFGRRATEASPPRAPESPYAPHRPAWDAAKQAALVYGQDPSLVVRAIAESLDAPEAFLRIPVGPDSVRLMEGRQRSAPGTWRG